MITTREIKFRAWFHDGSYIPSQMVYFDFHGLYLGSVNVKGKDGNIWTQCLCCYEQDEVHPPVMQYTGLHDKNGKEIYEGDIITPDHAPYCQGINDGESVVVEWLDCGGWYPFADNEDGAPYPKPQLSEVLGNIYENKELME